MNFERNEGGFMVGVSFILRTVYFEAYRINYKVKTISSKGEMKISLNLNVSAKEINKNRFQNTLYYGKVVKNYNYIDEKQCSTYRIRVGGIQCFRLMK